MFEKKRPVKRPRSKEWTHTFFCLSEVDADTVPTLNEQTALQLQGLGEKHFPLPLDADALDVDEILKREFPPLSDGGGYDLLTKDEGHLNVLRCPPKGYTTAFLKGVIGAAKVYVRPLHDMVCELILSGDDRSASRLMLHAMRLNIYAPLNALNFIRSSWNTNNDVLSGPASASCQRLSSCYYPILCM